VTRGSVYPGELLVVRDRDEFGGLAVDRAFGFAGDGLTRISLRFADPIPLTDLISQLEGALPPGDPSARRVLLPDGAVVLTWAQHRIQLLQESTTWGPQVSLHATAPARPAPRQAGLDTRVRELEQDAAHSADALRHGGAALASVGLATIVAGLLVGTIGWAETPDASNGFQRSVDLDAVLGGAALSTAGATMVAIGLPLHLTGALSVRPEQDGGLAVALVVGFRW